MIMENLPLQTTTQNNIKNLWGIEYTPGYVQQELAQTLQSKVVEKSEVILTHAQLYEVAWLFKQYDIQKPGWLRRHFVINQRRRKQLNDVLREAGLDGNWCGKRCDTNDWSGLLHSVWHLVNENQPCV